MSRDSKPGRRDLLRTIGRYGLLSALTLAGGSLAARKRDATSDSCVGDWCCRGCSVLQRCGLPPALSFRSKEKERAS